MSVWPAWLRKRQQGPQNRAEHRAELERQVQEQRKKRAAQRAEDERRTREAADAARAKRPPRFQVVNSNGDSIRDGNGQPFIFPAEAPALQIAAILNRYPTFGRYEIKDLNA